MQRMLCILELRVLDTHCHSRACPPLEGKRESRLDPASLQRRAGKCGMTYSQTPQAAGNLTLKEIKVFNTL
ncbi:hypothetical protein CO051_02135 [Candidatus Roizmanbacteria bacterium CG_4_9_14_0_2_um_filter_39_13]|uniref:Uncharacterized protein n=1 Tax=Candidatus Roizmanbacteria bacterium CG_4_9_14_0_2_um_filter_39_13 TaxID=1974839 RepID=A0A2M8F1C9_9BACT|nr:MAG: hypothetical protein COY15_05960 [Candidatus Roizmanbacteria bacterium CG_4_10_14_0_2_um_filter_39_12]PJC33060.1 MAG: hypothetical protein CO051_02135 [Candidatus Roizmanbacteria bacterium CG_4_9_14_0_2_um_filter_39_13]